MKTCKKCGRQLDDNCFFCEICGQDQNGPVIASPQGVQTGQQSYQGGTVPFQPEKKKNTAAIVAIVMTVLVILGVCGTLIFVLIKNKDNDLTSPAVSDESERAENDESETKERTKPSKQHSGGTDEQDDTEPENVPDTPADSSYDSLQDVLGSYETGYAKYVSSDVSYYPTVKVYFNVYDVHGSPIDTEDTYISVKEKTEGGQETECEVKSFSRTSSGDGVAFELICDRSADMESSLPMLQNALYTFTNKLDISGGDRAELISFDDSVMYMCAFTNSASLLQNGINSMSCSGGIAFYDALYQGIKSAAKQTGAKCVIAFASGLDTSSEHTSSDVINLALSNSVPVFIISTNQDAVSAYTGITTASGGSVWLIDGTDELDKAYNSIYSYFKGLYCLEYVSPADGEAFTYRDISMINEGSVYGIETSASFKPVETVIHVTHEERYEAVKKDISWTDANEECADMGGHLLTVTSEDELETICDIAKKAGLEHVWLGGYVSAKNGKTFGHWLTGEKFTYNKWADGEPSRTEDDSDDEKYIMLSLVNGEWVWSDEKDDAIAANAGFGGKTGYICEYEE